MMLPLIAITLRTISIDQYHLSSTNSRQEDTDITSTSNALQRACIKRLLVGKRINLLPPQYNTSTTSSSSSNDDLVLPCLSVKIPQHTSEEGIGHYKVLKFQVMDVQSVDNKQSLSTTSAKLVYVILPSTRIIFKSSSCRDNISDSREDELPSQTKDIPRLSFHNKQILLPHEHILESLHSILFIHTNNISLPIPRCFLFTGPPGVGKTYSVKKSIDMANSWFVPTTTSLDDDDDDPTISTVVPNATTNYNKEDDTIHLISIRGSELLASSSTSSGSNNYAKAACELQQQFELALDLVQCTPSEGNERPNKEGQNECIRQRKKKAVVIFLDEFDALVSSTSSSIVGSMLGVILDKMESRSANGSSISGWEQVIVIAATNRIDSIPSYLRRPGRLEKEVVVNPPNVDERFALLKSMLGGSSSSSTSEDMEAAGLHKVAEACVGYVAADLSSLVRRAATLAIEERFSNHQDSSFNSQGSSSNHHGNHPTISTQHLLSAMNDVGASCLRDATLSAPPKTTWDDIAGDAGGAKRALREAIEWPRTRRSAFKALGLTPPRGVLLHGPPGCAKTTLARAAAGAAGVAFLSLSPVDVYASSYVGEAEGIVRRAFDLARSAAPCVLFFDEIDAIIGGEDDGGGTGMGRGTSAEARVLSTFLNEMDGVDGSVDDGVLVLGATNRPKLLDAALLRPGRFDKVIYVPQPDEIGRRAILSMECRKWHNALSTYATTLPTTKANDIISPNSVEEYFNIDHLASDDVSGLMTGAEIVGVCRETAMQVIQHLMSTTFTTTDIAERCMKLLKEELESTLRTKEPLLSNECVLEEYTAFERERSA